ncbi:MAG: ATP-binding protein [Haliscomenobacter sp.]|uniref:ATP-binding protein n=1 Tax=Haliscomenobacter sp. TaxID=2717303 RepID=UPI0029B3BD11|nr:ATP-binding protein [Haliscomenobacter sp.]MDX2071075.1 ATP-binding protein [Haliscomenobacter sp.]
MRYFTLFLLLCSFSSFAQKQDLLSIDSIPTNGLVLNQGWKMQVGDDPEWTKTDYDDSQWKAIDPTQDFKNIPELWKSRTVWFRLKFTIDSSFTQKTLACIVAQTGASEIFLNGKMIGSFGKIGDQDGKVVAFTPRNGTALGLPLYQSGAQVLAVRFAVQKNLPYIVFAGRRNVALSLRLFEIHNLGRYLLNDLTPYFEFSRFGLYLIMAVIHFALFYFNKKEKANLYFFLFALINLLLLFIISVVYRHVDLASTKMFFLSTVSISYGLNWFFFLQGTYSIFTTPKGLIYWFLSLYLCASVFILYGNYHHGYDLGFMLASTLVVFEIGRIAWVATRKKQRGAKIILVGSIGYWVFLFLFYMFAWGYIPAGPNWIWGSLAINLGFISIPVAVSIYLALESSFASQSLAKKLKEVELLSQRNLAQEQEKQALLAAQNETLERQVAERTTELQQSLETLRSTQTQLIQREKMASLGELTAGIAHEIQNPLNFVNNFAEVSSEMIDELQTELNQGNTEEVQSIATDLKQNLDKINHHGKRASSIVKNMLDHSRTSTGKKEATDLNALIDECMRLSYHGLRAQSKGFQADFALELSDQLPLITLVPQDIGRVLLNLFNNAFYSVDQRFKRGGDKDYQPKVIASSHLNEQGIEIRISDNGSGIPIALQGKIFQPFFTTKPSGEGTGLGLSLSYDIITKGHQGNLLVESQEGQGTTFIIQLPLV